MFELIRKDFTLNKRTILLFISFPFLFGLLAYYADIPVYFLIYNMLDTSLALPFVIIIRNTKTNYFPILRSLPVKPRSIILSNYISAWISFIGIIIFNLIVFIGLEAVFSFNYAYNSTDRLFSSFMWHSTVLAVNIAIFFPIIITYGMGRVFLFAIFIFNLFILRLFSISGNGGFIYNIIYITESIKDAAKNYSLFVTSNFGSTVYYLTFILIIFLINYLSYKTLLFLFLRKEYKIKL